MYVDDILEDVTTDYLTDNGFEMYFSAKKSDDIKLDEFMYPPDQGSALG